MVTQRRSNVNSRSRQRRDRADPHVPPVQRATQPLPTGKPSSLRLTFQIHDSLRSGPLVTCLRSTSYTVSLSFQWPHGGATVRTGRSLSVPSSLDLWDTTKRDTSVNVVYSIVWGTAAAIISSRTSSLCLYENLPTRRLSPSPERTGCGGGRAAKPEARRRSQPKKGSCL